MNDRRHGPRPAPAVALRGVITHRGTPHRLTRAAACALSCILMGVLAAFALLCAQPAGTPAPFHPAAMPVAQAAGAGGRATAGDRNRNDHRHRHSGDARPLGTAFAGKGPPAIQRAPAARSPRGRRGEARGARVLHGRAWPVEGPRGSLRPVVTRAYEPPPTPWAAGHRGVDLAAHAGQRVRAAASGRVSFAGKVAGRGVVSIEVAGTGTPPLRTTYEPVRPSVRKGAHVRAGETVATLAPRPRHCATASGGADDGAGTGTDDGADNGDGCLHWGLLRGERYLDPLSLLPPGLLRAGPSRLLPVSGVPVPGTHAERFSRGRRSGPWSPRLP